MDDNTFYKLALDRTVDKDVCDWLDSLPRSRKAEVVRHALRYYINSLDDGEVIKMKGKGEELVETITATPIPSSPNKDIVVEIEPVEKKTSKLAIKSIPKEPKKKSFFMDNEIGGIVETD